MTDLVLIAPDIRAVAAGLVDLASIDDVVVWDEAFGHQAAVTVGKRRVIINERQLDPYGYQFHDRAPGPVTVLTHCCTADLDAMSALFTALGFQAQAKAETGDEVWFQSSEATGVVALHRSEAAEDRYTLGFLVSDDLAAVVARLRDAGYSPSSAAEGQPIQVTDPDGQTVTISTR